MSHLLGIGGIFFRSPDPKATAAWYAEHLGLPVNPWGGAALQWRTDASPEASTIWSPFADDTQYFGPSGQTFMVNFRVRDLNGLLAALRDKGVDVDSRLEESEFGRFGWCTDCDGRRVELWEPPEYAAPAP